MRGHYTPHSEETKRKISFAKKSKPTRYWLGKTRSQEMKDKVSKTKKGVKLSTETKNKMKGKIPWNKGLKGYNSGEKHPCWKGGLNRTEYQKYKCSTKWGEWRKSVFERDDYTCQDCGIKGNQTGGYLEPHHIIPMRDLIKNNLIDLIYEVSNGKTLCRKCHMLTFKRK